MVFIQCWCKVWSCRYVHGHHAIKKKNMIMMDVPIIVFLDASWLLRLLFTYFYRKLVFMFLFAGYLECGHCWKLRIGVFEERIVDILSYFNNRNIYIFLRNILIIGTMRIGNIRTYFINMIWGATLFKTPGQSFLTCNSKAFLINENEMFLMMMFTKRNTNHCTASSNEKRIQLNWKHNDCCYTESLNLILIVNYSRGKYYNFHEITKSYNNLIILHIQSLCW